MTTLVGPVTTAAMPGSPLATLPGQPPDLAAGLAHLQLACYDFTLRLNEPMTLPADKGAVLRGGFGLTFKRTVCIYPALPPCASCLLVQRCAYPPIFEPSPPPDAEVLRTHSDIPVAFVLEPPADGRTHYGAGEELTFGLVLIGQAINALPYFLVIFQRLGETGLGPARARYTLAQVTFTDPATGAQSALLTNGHFVPTAREQGVSAAAIMAAATPDAHASAPTSLTLHFHTPTTLKHNGHILHEAPPFHVIIRTLLRRVSSLSYFHGGRRWETDYRGWIARAETVTTTTTAVEWHEWSRYSTRTQRRMSLGGLVGSVTYAGDLTPFLPLLRLGELIHVGKNAVFGNGRFTVAVE